VSQSGGSSQVENERRLLTDLGKVC